MASSPTDTVVVQAFGNPGNPGQLAEFNFGNFTSFELSNSITEPSEASFEIGDDTGWDRLENLIGLGAQFMVFVNDRLRITGRVEHVDQPSNASQGATQRFVIRTAISDARYSSAPQGLRLKDASIREFVLGLYDSLGLVEFDFDFRGDVSRDLMTGRSTKNRRRPADLAPLKQDQAKVGPPETIFDAADRHLRRHGLMHWDAPDGKIVVAAPDDEQEPFAVLRQFRGTQAQSNNVMSITRTQDVSQAPTVLGVFGRGGKRGFQNAKVSSTLVNPDLVERGFRRAVVILDEAVRSPGVAERRARREFALRNRQLDRIEVTVDGLSYRDGPERLPWSPDTTVELIAEAHGGFLGVYYVESVTMRRNASEGDTTRLALVRQGVWVL